MTDNDELEDRLAQLLHGRAERLDPQLTGAQLRANSRRSAAPRRDGRVVAPLLAAAAVAVLAVGIQHVRSGEHSPHPTPIRPGAGYASVVAPAPGASSSPTTSVTQPDRRALLTPGVPSEASVPARPSTDPRPTPAAASIPERASLQPEPTIARPTPTPSPVSPSVATAPATSRIGARPASAVSTSAVSASAVSASSATG